MYVRDVHTCVNDSRITFFFARAYPSCPLSQHVKDRRQTPFPFVDIAKVHTKKMRSNLLKRIQKQKQKVGA